VAVGLELDIERRIRETLEVDGVDRATTLALEAYGAELMSYLVALSRSVTDADDVFGAVAEALWRGLPTFRWESSVRTLAYAIARNAYLKHVRTARRGGVRVALSSPSAEAVVAGVRSRTATYLQTEVKDKIAKLRAELDPEDQTLLILRVNRQLPWRDIARIMTDEGDASDDVELKRRAAALRKRFERLKEELREKAAGG
jgi:RNA polymerase sigma-70 factor, ECF subfamily